MWVSTSKGKFVRGPTAAELVGALLATPLYETAVVMRDLMHFVYVSREGVSRYAVWIRDGGVERQVRVEYGDAHDVAAAMIAFATRASFAAEVVDAMSAAAAA